MIERVCFFVCIREYNICESSVGLLVLENKSRGNGASSCKGLACINV